MRRKKSLLIPAVLAFSLCTGAVVPVSAGGVGVAGVGRGAGDT